MANEPTMTTRLTLWSLTANALLFLSLLILLRQSSCLHSAPCGEVERTSDTVTRYIARTDTSYRTITAYVPRVEHILVYAHDTISVPGTSELISCADTVVYSDSIYRAREFKAVINDLITANRIARRTVQWADLTPVTERTVTTTVTIEKKQPLLKVYLGTSAGVRYAEPLTRGGLDIAPAASLLIADRYMIDAGYYILGGEISAGVKVRLSFKK